MIPLDTPLFSTAKTAEAAALPDVVLKSWLQRGDLLIPTADADAVVGRGTGRSRAFSLRRALHVALTAEIAGAGLTVKKAAAMAARFTDFGESVAGYGSDLPPIRRRPGELFSDGRTIMHLVFPADGEPEGSVVRLQDIDLNEVFFTRDGIKQSDAVVLIDVTAIVDRVVARLGLSTQEHTR